jgi:ATP-dependent DNA helicase RecQ
MDQPLTLLKTVFGYDRFRPLQAEIIRQVLDRRDTLVVMPTGGGKSLCYQLPALIFEGLTLVISPLISLMKDQVLQLDDTGVDALCLNSSLSREAYAAAIARIREGKVRLLYLAPETLFKPRVLELLDAIRVDCVAIDEAHCISEWGHDFRPEYRQLATLRERFAKAAWIALTATATPRVRQDIKKSLGYSRSGAFIGSFDRENLYLEIAPKLDPLAQVLTFLQDHQGEAGIIYCLTRRQVDDLASTLRSRNHAVRPYHAGLSERERRENQEAFVNDAIQIVVATIAFGMGINKPDVRFVVHYDLPRNIESYYQEIGRAGRDGLRADCLLLFGYGDIYKVRHLIGQKEEAERKVAELHLDTLIRFLESTECRRLPLLTYFGQQPHEERCGMCDNCTTDDRERQDLTEAAQKFLSCAKRTQERFGIQHLIDVLCGSDSQKVKKFGHDRLSTYGIGKEYTKKQWSQLAWQFIHQGLLARDMEVGSLRLTGAAWEVFRGERTVTGHLPAETSRPAAPAAVAMPKHDRRLFALLRDKRMEIARGAGIPPYVVFADRTLIEMAAYFPQSDESLLTLHGIGQARLEKYGAVFRDLITAYCREHEIAEIAKEPADSRQKSMTGKGKRRYQISGDMFAGGSTITEIMEHFATSRTAVIDHLCRCQAEGTLFPAERLREESGLTKEVQTAAAEAFEEKGTTLLKPVFQHLEGRISYEDLKLLRLSLLGSAGKGGIAE